ncbi:methyl-accepting chemotaxis protein [Ahrensia kielensis]|uniref:methyl-accepting chemotaxis protein n=1 Tax=Ahrensia kielensis TaxID=76980 RepID=UPI00037B8218|nr:methyl-accepting chemotaxis protein [Ahrensia kielensis]
MIEPMLKAEEAEDAYLDLDAEQLAENLNPEGMADVIAHVGGQISTLAVNIADTSGIVGDVASAMAKQSDAFADVYSSAEEIAVANVQLSDVLSQATSIADGVQQGLKTTTESVEEIFTAASSDITAMAQSADTVTNEFSGVKEKISEVYNYSESIQKIASETQMLAINAGIIATRAGDAGKGFSIIASSVRELAVQTSEVSKNITARLNALEATVSELVKHGETSRKLAAEAMVRSEKIDAEFGRFREFGDQVDTLTASIGEIVGPVDRNSELCGRIIDTMGTLNGEVKVNSAALSDTSNKFDTLVSFTEEMILLIEQSGVETEDSQIIRHCVDAAERTAALFEQAVAAGTMSISALFDENYQPIPNSNPQQVRTQFTDFTDRVMPDIQEPFLELDTRIAFCAAIDRNGYLPTHNNIYSKPQSNDPIWNAANCRNRRIFNDRTGLAAGRNTKPFLMQTYRRDMGGGVFSLMKDLSAPIFVQGRHWGAIRVGCKIAN